MSSESISQSVSQSLSQSVSQLLSYLLLPCFVCLFVCFSVCLDTDGSPIRIAAPSAPPSRLHATSLDSQSLLVSWLDVPPEHRNGIIRGYRLTYSNISNRTSPVISERAYSVVLTQLRKATEYRIRVWAFNSAGDGVSGLAIAMTGEDGGYMV